MKKIGVCGCKHTTRDFILGLERCGFRVDHCITIGPEEAKKQKVCGYYELFPFLRDKGIPFTVAKEYSLKSETDKKGLLSLCLDILLVIGWQRLIPNWWLEGLGIGAFGMHGSSRPLPYGRGRSPMNWSLIQNKNIFYTHLFKYMPGVDNGPIVGMQTFDITPFDTCLTLHFKNTIAMVNLCKKYLPSLLDGTAVLTSQPREGESYYPKRSEEDGLIYWQDSSLNIYNLARAATHPFPGAYTFLDNDPSRKILIWKVMPFSSHFSWDNAIVGEITEVFYDGTFVVKTGDSSLLILESQGHKFTNDDIGRKFGHLDIPRKIWKNLPE